MQFAAGHGGKLKGGEMVVPHGERRGATRAELLSRTRSFQIFQEEVFPRTTNNEKTPTNASLSPQYKINTKLDRAGITLLIIECTILFFLLLRKQ